MQTQLYSSSIWIFIAELVIINYVQPCKVTVTAPTAHYNL